MTAVLLTSWRSPFNRSSIHREPHPLRRPPLSRLLLHQDQWHGQWINTVKRFYETEAEKEPRFKENSPNINARVYRQTIMKLNDVETYKQRMKRAIGSASWFPKIEEFRRPTPSTLPDSVRYTKLQILTVFAVHWLRERICYKMAKRWMLKGQRDWIENWLLNRKMTVLVNFRGLCSSHLQQDYQKTSSRHVSISKSLPTASWTNLRPTGRSVWTVRSGGEARQGNETIRNATDISSIWSDRRKVNGNVGKT